MEHTAKYRTLRGRKLVPFSGNFHPKTLITDAGIRAMKKDLAKREALQLKLEQLSDTALGKKYQCSGRYVRRVKTGLARANVLI